MAALWKEDDKCVEWLNRQDPGSVLYVSFGSITIMSGEQFEELAMGLEGSGSPVLWVIRPDLMAAGVPLGGHVGALPAEIVGEGLRHRGRADRVALARRDQHFRAGQTRLRGGGKRDQRMHQRHFCEQARMLEQNIG